MSHLQCYGVVMLNCHVSIDRISISTFRADRVRIVFLSYKTFGNAVSITCLINYQYTEEHCIFSRQNVCLDKILNSTEVMRVENKLFVLKVRHFCPRSRDLAINKWQTHNFVEVHVGGV